MLSRMHMSTTGPIKNFIAELKRRKVFRVALVYAAIGWVLVQIAEATFEPLQLPEWTMTLLIVLVVFGFPLAIGMAWALEVTPQGIRREITAEDEQSKAGPPPDKQGVETSAPSIAVLPFADMSPDKDQDYFCEGIAEEILNALTRIEGLRVASRTSAFQFKDGASSIQTVARELGVKTVLEGSVRKAGSQLRVTAQLINSADGYHLWSERFDGSVEDVFAIQDEIANKIADALRVRFGPQAKDVLQIRATTTIQAYDYYLRGRQLSNQFGKSNLENAIKMFDKAIEIDPEYAPAYSGLADSYAILYMFFVASQSNCERAQRASARASELAPNSTEAHVSRGLAEMQAKRFELAEQAFERAIEIDPQMFEAYYYYGRSSTAQGEFEKAVELFEKAAKLRPEDYQSLLLTVQIYRSLGRDEDSREAARRGLERTRRTLALNPADVRALYLGAAALSMLDQREEATEWGDRALAIDPDEPSVLYNVACLYSVMGRLDDAMDLLERALLPGMANRLWVMHDSDLDPLRKHPRFKAFLKALS